MGEVWRAVHQTQNVQGAVKFMTPKHARNPKIQSSFRGEVRAMARLDHPGIITIYDCGQVDDYVAHASNGYVVEGSSYLAMELASHTLLDLDKTRMDWQHARKILLSILDALAHSHARGVIHRDLKPANVLLVTSEQGTLLKLSDFGLAHAADNITRSDLLDSRISGTPRFMAPEQIVGRFRDQGPWTDLYAVGCLAYWLTSGSPPFSDGDTTQILRGHLFNALPKLTPEFAVPDDFHAWIKNLLAKQPGDRYQYAADASRALLALDPMPGESMKAHQTSLDFLPLTVPLDVFADQTMVNNLGATVPVVETVILPALQWSNAQPLAGATADYERINAPIDFDDAPNRPTQLQPVHKPGVMPDDWRPLPLNADAEDYGQKREFTDQRGNAAGLGLFGLRQIPLVGRIEERTQIWQSLRNVNDTRQPRGVILRGVAGTGKSRLAEWICERAHEVGTASSLKAVQGPLTGPADGIERMFSDHLRCTGLGREKILERVRYLMGLQGPLTSDDLHDCLALTEIIAPTADPDYDESRVRVRFSNPTERYVVLKRALQRLTRHRPLIIFLDDVQWNTETIGFAQYLLNTPDIPVLLLMTVREEALLSRPTASAQLDALHKLPTVDEIIVSTLDENERIELVQHLLGMEDTLVSQIAQRTGGNPLFAVQLVGDWVGRNLLDISPRGFRLRSSEAASLPENMRELLFRRIELLIEQPITAPPNDALLALELAAALGQEVDSIEWTMLCKQHQIHGLEALVESMASNRLATIDRHGWTFAHGALRESLEFIARTNNRWTTHQFACAKMLRGRYGYKTTAVAYRLARHLLEAERPDDALDPLLRAANYFSQTCQFDQAHAAYNRYESALDELNIADDDPRALEVHIQRSLTLIRQSRFSEADALLVHIEPLARQAGYQKTLADILHARGLVAKMNGDIREGILLAEEAIELYSAINDRSGLAHCYFLVGELSYWSGDMNTAGEFYAHARQLFTTIGNEHEIAVVKLAKGARFIKLDDYEQATAMILDAMGGFERTGDNKLLANCLNNLGEVYRFQNNLDKAEEYYTKSLSILERIGLDDDIIAPFNLGQVLIAQGKFAQADVIMAGVLNTLLPTKRSGYLGLAHTGMLPGAAARNDWNAWDHHLSQATQHLELSAMVDIDLANLAELAANLAHQSHQTDRAHRAWQLALDQYQSLDDQTGIDRTRAALDATSSIA